MKGTSSLNDLQSLGKGLEKAGKSEAGGWPLDPAHLCLDAKVSEHPTALPFSPNTPRNGRKWRFQGANSGPVNPFHHTLTFVHQLKPC